MRPFTAPVVNALVRIFGTRRVLLVGGHMAAAGFILAALSSDIYSWGVFIIGFAGQAPAVPNQLLQDKFRSGN